MPKLFSIDIFFKKQHYPALVSVREDGNDVACMVRYADKRLRYILPGDVIVFNLKEGIRKPYNSENALTHELVACTSKAISKHLETSTLSPYASGQENYK
jgi:ASC-1-like (ASCH) protein